MNSQSIQVTLTVPNSCCHKAEARERLGRNTLPKARIFLLVDLREFLSDLGSGTKKKALKMTELFFFNISRKNSKTSKVNQQSVFNL